MQKRLFVVGVLGVTVTLLSLLINSMPTPAKAAGMNNPPDHTNLYSFSFNHTGLLSACFTPILQYGDFEGPFSEVSSVWQKSDSADFSDVSYQSNRGIALPASAGHEPSIYQTFELPMGLSPDTSVVLQLKKGVDLKGGSSNPEDKLYFVLRRDSDGAEIIPPTLLADGQDRTTEIPPIPDLDPNIYSPDQWTEFNQDILSGVNPFYFLEAGDTVQAYFYVSDPGVDTSFFLDNISLTFCTAPLPPPEAIYLPTILKNQVPAQNWHTLDVNKTASPSPVQAGGLLTYAIHYSVLGNEPAPGLTIIDTMPQSTTYQKSLFMARTIPHSAEQ